MDTDGALFLMAIASIIGGVAWLLGPWGLLADGVLLLLFWMWATR